MPMKKKILLGLTTTPDSDWRGKIKEIDKLGIKEVALFPTFIELTDRKEMYALLEKTGLERIPHVHLRDDMEEWELDFLSNRYRAEVFNIHANRMNIRYIEENSKYLDIIFVENLGEINDEYCNVLKGCAGICLDTSHWEDMGKIQKQEGYEKFLSLVENNKVGCCHISAISKEAKKCEHYITKKEMKFYSQHWLTNLNQLDYVKDYVKYLPKYVSIELENSFEEQVEIKKYLEKIINPVKSR